ncbi:MAG: hypothetical protein AAGH15_09455 [Myxococcota bacterium]
MRAWLAPLLALVVAGCGEEALPALDAGPGDAGPVDLGVMDGGGDVDAGTQDAGTQDTGTGDAGAEDAGTGEARRVLFVGNSYTFYNDLPELYAATAPSSPEVASRTAGGWTLVRHAGDAELATLLAEGWDVVVLQEQSQIPGFPEGNADRAASLASAEALAAAAGAARIVLFLTWGRRDGDARNPDLFPDYATMQGRLNAGYAAMRDALEAAGHTVVIAPVGPAFGELEATDEALFRALYAGDGSHPSPLGSQLAALVFARVIGGADLEALARPDDVGEDDWAALVRAVRDAATP